MEVVQSVGVGPPRPVVFLSSVFKDTFGDAFQPVPLRQRILEEKRSLPVWLWAYEHYWPENVEDPGPDADTIIDRCFAGIKSADLFVFILTKRHGSGVTYFEDPSWASYLELELFAAAILRKPIVVLHLRGHEPEDALRDTLLLLSRAFTTGEYIIDNENGLYRRFRELCDSLAAGTLKFRDRSATAHLPEWLSVQRSRPGLEEDLLDPSIMFLGGQFTSPKPSANPDRAARLLAQVSSGMRPSPVAGQSMLPHGAALFRIWAAMRELMDKKGTTLSDPSTAVLWDRGLGLWASRASWFGLHGHVWMGPLAAVNSQTALRAAFASSPEYAGAQDVREPLGARASAIYSIAQRMDTRWRKLWHYRQVLILTTQAIERDTGAQQGALSIRGHAQMQMARLGIVWKLWHALEDFKNSLELRINAGAAPANVGEAMTDLGFCYVLIGKWNKGLSLLQEGVVLMRNDASATGKAFLARGLRKLEHAAKLTGAWSLARKVLEERLAVSVEAEALDQARET
jgi:hypothetical protein